MLLYRTIAGSRLYGTNRPDSDYDWIEVYSSMRHRPNQKIVGDQDTTRVSLSTFMKMANEGSHQYLEAMFAPKAEVDMFCDMRSRYFVHTAKTITRYRQTINKFGDHKMRKREKAMKTALRLTYNLEEIIETGRFNPRLDSDKIAVLQSLTWDQAHDATQDRMNYLSERYGL